MSNQGFHPHNLVLLKGAALDLPKTRPSGDFGDFLEHTFEGFFQHLGAFEEPLASLLASRRDCVRVLSTAVIAAWRLGWKGDLDNANRQLDAGLREVRKEIISISRRHTAKVLPGQCWYRLAAWKGVQSRKHMFHAPFELPQKSYRFSAPGTPALYLGNSVFLCWLECGEPCLDSCFVSRFEIDTTGFELLDIACNHQAYVAPLDFGEIPGLDVDPRRVTNSPYAEGVLLELTDYLTVWPLFAAASVQKLDPTLPHHPEYVIPQLLMRWAQQSENFLGIRYFTSKQDPSTNSQDWSINLALPARTQKKTGYCDFLRARVRCTEPQPLSWMRDKTFSELAAPEAVDRRERRRGRVMLQRPDVGFVHYCDTEFGKMEYWLERPQLGLDRIESD